MTARSLHAATPPPTTEDHTAPCGDTSPRQCAVHWKARRTGLQPERRPSSTRRCAPCLTAALVHTALRAPIRATMRAPDIHRRIAARARCGWTSGAPARLPGSGRSDHRTEPIAQVRRSAGVTTPALRSDLPHPTPPDALPSAGSHDDRRGRCAPGASSDAPCRSSGSWCDADTCCESQLTRRLPKRALVGPKYPSNQVAR